MEIDEGFEDRIGEGFGIPKTMGGEQEVGGSVCSVGQGLWMCVMRGVWVECREGICV